MHQHFLREVLSSAGSWDYTEEAYWRESRSSLDCTLLQEIEARLRQKVASVNPDLSLPADIAARTSAAPGSAAYGQHKGGDTASKVSHEPHPVPCSIKKDCAPRGILLSTPAL